MSIILYVVGSRFSCFMRVLTWNLQGEIGISEDRLRAQRTFLDQHTRNVDLFLLQAVNAEEGAPGRWQGHLGALLAYFSDRGYETIHTGDWAQELAASTGQPHADVSGSHNRCTLTASRWPLERHALSIRPDRAGYPTRLNYYYVHFPEKLLVGEVDITATGPGGPAAVSVWNVGIVNGAGWGEEKLNMLETVYARLFLQTTKTDDTVLLGGDFNGPKRERADGTIVPHGRNAGQYTDYPYYGHPYYLADEEGDFAA